MNLYADGGKSIKPSQILSIWREDGVAVWTALYQLPHMEKAQKTTIGTNGAISTGSRLSELMKVIEQDKGTVRIPHHALTDDSTMTIRSTGNNITYLEIGVDSYKKVLRDVDAERKAAKEKNKNSGYSENYMLEYIRDASTLVIGKVVKVKDGDTIDIRVEKASSGIEEFFPASPVITIRFVGIQAPEMLKADGSHKESNARYARRFNITEDQVLEVAKESTDFVVSTLGNNYVIVSLDIEEDGRLQKDAYNRYVGMVYATSFKKAEDAFTTTSSVLNVNKTLIATSSKKYKRVPLAVPYGSDNEFGMNLGAVGGQYKNYSKFDYLLWDVSIALGAKEVTSQLQSEEKKREQEATEQAIRQAYDTQRTTLKVIDYEVKPGDTAQSIAKKHNIPLDVLAKANNMTVDKLVKWLSPEAQGRMVGSPIKIPAFNVAQDGKIVFGDNGAEDYTDNTNNIPVIDRDASLEYALGARKYGSDSTRIGDVRLTIPPLSIQVNRTSHIEKVKTLRSKSSLVTKAGSSTTTITLQLYFHDLESINGTPIGAYGEEIYYIDGLRPLIAQFQKVPFVPIENEYLNEIHDIHAVALANLTITTVPGFPHSLSATLTLAKFEHLSYMPQVEFLDDVINYPLMRWFYQQNMKYQNPYRSYLAPIAGELRNDFVFQIADEATLVERQQAIQQLRQLNSLPVHQSKIANGKSLHGQLKKDFDAITSITEQYARYLELKRDGVIKGGFGTGFIGIGSTAYRTIYGTLNRSKVADTYYHPPELDQKIQAPIEGSAGYAVVKLSAPSNQSDYAKYKMKDGRYAIPMDQIGTTITRRAKDAEIQTKAYENNYIKLQNKANAMEGELPLVNWKIDNLILTSINIMYENSFTPLQLQLGDSPTLQYLGCQDPYVQLSFETVDRDAVQSLQELLKTSDEFSKKYKYGITSGFLGFDNQLTKLFGITTVMVENVVVNTVPGTVNLYRVDMVLCGFNKTQKRSETLEGFSGAYSTNKDDRHVSKDPIKNDVLVFHHNVKKMEVYPDLELPTYEELERVLPRLRAGITSLKSKNGGIYVDPDFYIAAAWTFRELMEAHRKNGKGEMKFRDWFEDSAETKITTDANNLIIFNDDTLQLMETISERTRNIQIVEPTSINSYMPGINENVQMEGTDMNYGSGPMAITGSVQTATQFKKEGGTPSQIWAQYKPIYENPPSLAEWASMYGHPQINSGIQQMYDAWKRSIKNPSTRQVYEEICRWVDHYFKNEYLDDRQLLANSSDHRDYAYASTNDLYIATYNHYAPRYGAKKLSTSGLRLKESLVINYGAKPSRERIINYLKTLFDKESRWSQFRTDKSGKIVPNRNTQGSSAMGIGQIMLSVHATSPSMIRRLTWDWKYNIEYSVKYFYEKYREAKVPRSWLIRQLKQGVNAELELVSRPLDWAVRSYQQGGPVTYYGSAQDVQKYTGKLVTPYYQDFVFTFEGPRSGSWDQNKHGRYNNYAARYASPNGTIEGSAVDHTIVQSVKGLNNQQMKIIGNDRNALIEEIVANKFWHDSLIKHIKSKGEAKVRDKFKKKEVNGTDIINDMNLAENALNRLSSLWGSNWFEAEKSRKATFNEMLGLIQKSKSHTRAYLQDSSFFTDKEIESFYEKIIGKMTKPGSNHGGALGISGTAQQAINHSQVANYQVYQEVRELEISEHNRLVCEDDPAALFRGSFTDLAAYDQRGRLSRAFPTFQMFIIDEGRWMSSYRLWDNFYGFNAIQSIDIHRSRKIVADTAVIKMTNIYSNLTSRRMDENYGEWDWSLWDNFIKEEPNQELLDARSELVQNMMLQTGARIHLRMGYGSNAADLPVVFNGTITEISAQEIVEVIAQGDGIELTSVISADPNDTNNGLFSAIVEPRDLLCRLMNSKGNWFKNAINYATDGEWFKESPSGIAHFGAPVKIPWAHVEFRPFNRDFDESESTQNIYSSNGQETYSNWIYSDGTEVGIGYNFVPMFNPLAEAKIEIKLYGKTTWDVANTLAYCSPDYIVAILPFEQRSTLFFGKPYYPVAYAYNKEYKLDPKTGKLEQATVRSERRKPYMQYRMYNSYYDIVSNQIKASEDGMYTNVVVRYHGGSKGTDLIQADMDIRFDKQRTAVVDTDIVANFELINNEQRIDHKKQALFYGCSTIRDYMKDMYKGQLIVLGDPSAKPHDLAHLADESTTMNGPFMVESVTHHFSHETGFITALTPDALVIIDDKVMLSHTAWFTSVAAGATSYLVGKYLGAKTMRALAGTRAGLKVVNGANWGGKQLVKLTTMLPTGNPGVKEFQGHLRKYVDAMSKGDLSRAGHIMSDINKTYDKMGVDLKNWDASGGRTKSTGKAMFQSVHNTLGEVMKDLNKSTATGKIVFSNTKKAVNGVKAVRVLTATNPLSLIAGIGIGIGVDWVGSMWVNSKYEKQAVTILPMQYMGRNFTAGINGHKGLVVGDPPGKWDNFYMGYGFSGDDKGFSSFLGKGLNLFLDGDALTNIARAIQGDETVFRGSVDFSNDVTYEDLYSGKLRR